ncbi:unnamed protein product [Gadus morhua 'NCC']
MTDWSAHQSATGCGTRALNDWAVGGPGTPSQRRTPVTLITEVGTENHQRGLNIHFTIKTWRNINTTWAHSCKESATNSLLG